MHMKAVFGEHRIIYIIATDQIFYLSKAFQSLRNSRANT